VLVVAGYMLLGISLLLIVSGLCFVVWGMRTRLAKVNARGIAPEEPKSPPGDWWKDLIPLMKKFVTTLLSKQSTPPEGGCPEFRGSSVAAR
jgi:hypothetical protein